MPSEASVSTSILPGPGFFLPPTCPDYKGLASSYLGYLHYHKMSHATKGHSWGEASLRNKHFVTPMGKFKLSHKVANCNRYYSKGYNQSAKYVWLTFEIATAKGFGKTGHFCHTPHLKNSSSRPLDTLIFMGLRHKILDSLIWRGWKVSFSFSPKPSVSRWEY